jgi:UDP-N-acetylglucosamine--N-acetylmuramyl-(pentapeptide) pyrophosphoryl-undecaprenol N-acetylglucosamine transferase
VQKNNGRYIISGGGTGGHLYPAISVAEELLRQGLTKKNSKEDILFVGTQRGIEARVIPQEGYRIEFLNVSGFVGKSLPKKIAALFKFALSFKDAWRILQRFRPVAVIGCGGYASLTMTLTASLKGIPTIILEQNSVPGLANRVLGRVVDAVCITYAESMAYFPKEKTFHTGNPIRSKILNAEPSEALKLFPIDSSKKTVFVFGGSAGATAINNALIEALPYLLDLKLYLQFIHQTGEKDYDKVTEHYKKAGFSAYVFKFIEHMAEAYSLADLLICRAGASTLSEITAAGKASILIPYPYAAANHQEKNALRLEALNAARVLKERDLSGEHLAATIRKLLIESKQYLEMAKAASLIGMPEATEKVVSIIVSTINRYRR